MLFITLSMIACAVQPPQQQDVLALEKEADLAYKAKKWQEAEEKYTQLIVLTPNTAEVWFRLGNIYAHTKKPNKAVAAYREAVVRHPAYAKAWNNLGVMSLRQTTALYLEMLTHLEYNSKQYKQAKEIAKGLVELVEKRRKYNVQKDNTFTIKPSGNSEPVTSNQ